MKQATKIFLITVAIFSTSSNAAPLLCSEVRTIVRESIDARNQGVSIDRFREFAETAISDPDRQRMYMNYVRWAYTAPTHVSSEKASTVAENRCLSDKYR